MTANQTTVLETEKDLLARITLNPKGNLMLENSNGIRLCVLLSAFGQGHTNQALLKRHHNLDTKDLAAARLYAYKLAREGKVELPHSQPAKIISLPTANAQPAKPITIQPAKVGGMKNANQVTTNTLRSVISVKTLSTTIPTEMPSIKPEPPKSVPVQAAKPVLVQANPFPYSEKLNLKERTTNFGLQIIQLYDSLPQTAPAQVLGNQLLRSGTSVGAHCREAMFTRTQAEFISKISVGLQELEESKHWFQLLVEGRIVAASRLAALRQEADELTAILIATVILTKTKPGEKYG